MEVKAIRATVPPVEAVVLTLTPKEADTLRTLMFDAITSAPWWKSVRQGRTQREIFAESLAREIKDTMHRV